MSRFEALRDRYDAVVIGGGINGLGVAREAAADGYRVLLVERQDFGAGTTSRSTRLIHGGLRYLEHGEIGLVREALREREALFRRYPHLVRPIRFLLPVYRGDPRGPWKIRAGLLLYDLLSPGRSVPRHRGVPLERALAAEPALAREGLQACFEFSDGQVEWPERLCVEVALEAAARGATLLTHVEAVGLELTGAGGWRVRIRDGETGDLAEIDARIVVNVAGPWVDSVLGLLDGSSQRLIGGTRGTHLVVRYPDGGPRHPLFTSARSDGRPIFVLPWFGMHLIGTTDVRYEADPGDARATATEVRYLLSEANALLPGAALSESDVLYTYCGVRPLPYRPGVSEAAIPRGHRVVDHGASGGPPGLFSVVGGKLTTFRSLGRQAAEMLRRALGPRPRGPAAPRRPFAPAPDDVPMPLWCHLRSLYGPDATDVVERMRRDASLREPVCAHNPDTLAQVARAADTEMARTLADVFLRRTGIGWTACHGLDGAERAAAVLAERLGRPASWAKEQVQAYGEELERTLAPVERALEEA
ncbi:MAG TPA: glycerol-3-phosphate dehydrogenase/oxidase [Dehalococcoidia bacterium]|nr:glycerol-3-phosphate dehydrogenase/oxidase [Dehalococcoidia bacterium]